MKTERIKTLKNHIIDAVKAFSHAIFIPTLIAIIVYQNTAYTLLECELIGMIYLLVPFVIYHEAVRPEPAGFYILALTYIYGMLITWSIQGGQYVL